MLDDIDRLTTSEIRDIFKPVRLTANFPNIIYIVAFDRIRVEKALTEQNIPGRDYLEKILQVSFDLPAVPAHVLSKQVTEAISDALSNDSHKLVSESAAHSLEKDWRDEVRLAAADVLAKEPELLRLLLLAKQKADPTEPHIEIADSPPLTLALLQSAHTEERSQSLGSRAVRRSPRLFWDELIELYGDESILRERIERLKDLRPEGS